MRLPSMHRVNRAAMQKPKETTIERLCMVLTHVGNGRYECDVLHEDEIPNYMPGDVVHSVEGATLDIAINKAVAAAREAREYE